MKIHKITGAKESINTILWIMEAKQEGYIKRDYMDWSEVWYPITLDRLLHEVNRSGQFGVELKRHSWLGEPSDITILEFT